MSAPLAPTYCKHCERTVVLVDGVWSDLDAQGDDSVWRETCDAVETFTAEHEPMLPPCFAGGCLATERYVVSNPSTPLCEPVTACQAHVGDLLGNAAKVALRADPTVPVTLRVERVL